LVSPANSFAILASTIDAPKGGYVLSPSLLWLISTLIIVGVALHEENVMVRCMEMNM
jgi:hypothetical protein